MASKIITNTNTLEQIEDLLCEKFISGINTWVKQKDGGFALLSVTNIWRVQEASGKHVKKILDQILPLKDKEYFQFILGIGLRPKKICNNVFQNNVLNIERKFAYINQIIEYAIKNDKIQQYFSESVLLHILTTSEYVNKDDTIHILDFLKLLDEKGISLRITNNSNFNYEGLNTKEIFRMLLKHNTNKDYLLEHVCTTTCDVETIKYLINDLGASWNREISILQYVSGNSHVSEDLLRFLIEDLKIPTTTKDKHDRTPFDNILKIKDGVDGRPINYMLCVDAPLSDTTKITDPTKRAMLAYFGKINNENEDTINLEFLEQMIVLYLKEKVDKISEGKLLGKEIFQTEFEPVWNPQQINFHKVPLNHLLDAIKLYWNGSYETNHPYYQKVFDLYGKKPGLKKAVSEISMFNVKFFIRTISRLLLWSPYEKEEQERESKRHKQNF